jgi:3-oxoacyl-[acyl-carrier protein] reductase
MSRVAVITGGTRGLGRETALVFGRKGYKVVVFYAANDFSAGQVRARFEQEGIEGKVVRHDITSGDPDVWNLPEILEAESLLLVHNACTSFSPRPMHLQSWSEVQSNLDVALKGGWICSQAVIRMMLKRKKGTIVNVLTSALNGPAPKGFAAYLSAKYALRGLNLAIASEYASRGIRVFGVLPGFMETSLTDSWDERLRDAIRSGSGRVSDPAQAANRIWELVEDSTVIGNGEEFPI